MPKLSKSITFETATGIYEADEIIGEGAAGRVFGAKDADGTAVAIKVLAQDKASTDKRKRFKNELMFLARNKHPNIVSVTDHGIAAAGPFYVMRRYDSSLRALMISGVPGDQVLFFFSQILDGTEAAHLQKVIHRDLKPENILFDKGANTLAIADFGTARFTEDQLIATANATEPGQRLANFQYAAPEQRSHGKEVGVSADIYALADIIHEE